MLYMVYTNGGRYQAMQLLPGNYELSVQAKGLVSDVQKLVLSADQKATANVTLHDEPAQAAGRVEELAFDQLYPDGQGKKIAQRLCIRCHGPNFLPAKQWPAEQWNAAINMMRGNGFSQGAQIQPSDLSEDEREVLVKYLVQNFGPDSKPSAVKVQVEMPVDETKINKAMYIEYYWPVDPPGQGVNAPEYASVKSAFGKRRVSQDVIIDRQGYVWGTDRGIPNRITKLDPRTGEFKEFLTPAPKAGIHDLMIDHEGMIWVPDRGEPTANANVFDPKTEKWVAAYPMDPDGIIKGDAEAQSVVEDPKGNMYFGYIIGNALSVWDRETKKAKVFQLPTPNSYPYGIVRDSKGNIWIAEFHGGKIAKFDPKTTKFTEYTSPTYPALIRRLGVDSKDNIWFGLFSAGKLEHLDTQTGKIKEFDIPHENSQPYDEKESPDGKIWISDAGQGGALILFDPTTKTFTYYPTPQRSDIPKIRVSRNGSVWYGPRSGHGPGVGVLYPDMTKINSLAPTT